jgi:hypothetical protein
MSAAMVVESRRAPARRRWGSRLRRWMRGLKRLGRDNARADFGVALAVSLAAAIGLGAFAAHRAEPGREIAFASTEMSQRAASGVATGSLAIQAARLP